MPNCFSVYIFFLIYNSHIFQLKKKRVVSKPKTAATEAALKEVKERSKTSAAAKKGSAVKTGGAPIIPSKTQQRPGFNSRGGSKR